MPLFVRARSGHRSAPFGIRNCVMNPTALLPLLVVFAAGGMIALQAPTNAIIARAGGSAILAALISFAVGTAGLLFVWVATGNRSGTTALGGLPWYAWLGGLYGATFVA